ncbi:MAG: NADH-quinone oxidoreductase subunit H [Proteobacteria bacterium]|nr:NADH-quinone oxidoreductase subunit H [Pseudomonadota bacterium]
MLAILAWSLLKIAVMLGFAVGLSALLTWMERRQSAMMQDRIGPVRANIGSVRLKGLFHPLADALKLLFKEDFIPPRARKGIYLLAPVLALVPVLLVFAVIPFGPPLCASAWRTVGPDLAACRPEALQIAQIDIGLLFVFAVASLGAYGAVLAGWSSFNNFGLLGGLRAAAQMISYEVTMGLAVVGVLLVYGTLEPMALVQAQASLWDWGIIRQPLGFVLFLCAAIAETKRAPFDIPEGESEIVGYFVEYSGTRFMMFYLAEFLEIVFVGCLVTTIFFGGWQLPGLADDGLRILGHYLPLSHGLVVLARVLSFFAKVFLVCFLQLAIRWTLPRLRFDQLMRLGWKSLLPASIFNIVVTAGVLLAAQAAR